MKTKKRWLTLLVVLLGLSLRASGAQGHTSPGRTPILVNFPR